MVPISSTTTQPPRKVGKGKTRPTIVVAEATSPTALPYTDSSDYYDYPSSTQGQDYYYQYNDDTTTSSTQDYYYYQTDGQGQVDYYQYDYDNQQQDECRNRQKLLSDIADINELLNQVDLGLQNSTGNSLFYAELGVANTTAEAAEKYLSLVKHITTLRV